MLLPEEHRRGIIDGAEEDLITASGVLVVAYIGWKEGTAAKGEQLIRNYCGYLIECGHSGTAEEIFCKLDGMDTASALRWLRYTKKEFCLNPAEMIKAVIPK